MRTHAFLAVGNVQAKLAESKPARIGRATRISSTAAAAGGLARLGASGGARGGPVLPKKPAEAKNNSDPDKVKTDERMSTRGLKPPPKDADKDKTTKPDSKTTPTPDSTNPK